MCVTTPVTPAKVSPLKAAVFVALHDLHVLCEGDVRAVSFLHLKRLLFLLTAPFCTLWYLHGETAVKGAQ